MNAKQGFHWKSIEIKPENSEKLHLLIQDAYLEKTDKEVDKYWDKGDVLMEVLLSQFEDLRSLVPQVAAPPTGKGDAKKKKAVKLSKKEEIMIKVEKDLVKKDIVNIRFDTTLRPLTHNFSMEPTFDMMIFVWNFLLSQKVRPDPLNVLDGVISLNRIMDRDAELLQKIPTLWGAMNNLKTTMNARVDESMYSLLFQNPILLIESTADKRKKSIHLYKEQKQILDKIAMSVTLDEPLLMGNQMPTGTGKSFLAVPIAQKIASMKRGKTVLFACSNELVNLDIASTALLGDNIHLWMSSLIRDENSQAHVLLRPYKRCFPAKWKAVYKQEDDSKIGSITEQWNYYVENTGKNPDIIVADLDACYELLRNADEIGNPFIAYIDEFISDEQSNKMMAKICHHLPRQTVLLSAILPRFANMDPIVQNFCSRYETTPEECLHRVETTNVPITCAVIDQEGKLRMPHHIIETREQLLLLMEEMRINPRIRRCYTAKHVYYWAHDMEELLTKAGLAFRTRFPNIGKIQNNNVILYAIELLEYLGEHMEHLEVFKRYRPIIMDPPDRNKIFKEQSSCYEGKTLFISNDTFQHVYDASTDFFDPHLKWSSIVANIEKNRKEQEIRLEKLQNMKVTKGNAGGFNKLEKEKAMAQISDAPTMVYIPRPYVLNSKEHFMRYHPGEPLPKNFVIRNPNILPEMFNDAFSDHENLLIASGAGFYDRSKMTSHQRNLIMTEYKHLFFMGSCKDIVFGTNLPDLVNVFISREFAAKESIPILYQLMGRVGRMGRSYHANIILDDEESVRKILSLDANIDHKDIQSLLVAFLE